MNTVELQQEDLKCHREFYIICQKRNLFLVAFFFMGSCILTQQYLLLKFFIISKILSL
jgi:hypothetical protein